MNQNQICCICEQQPEDLLILSCQHNLCVNCATEVFALNNSSQKFVCEICLSQTCLDQETVQYLGSLIQPPSIQPIHKPPKTKSKPQKNQNKICQLHHEPQLYYCFDCQTSNICSECILTPKHQKHHVYTLKKAQALIKKQATDCLRIKQSLKDQLYSERAKMMEIDEQMNLEIDQRKGEIKYFFDEIVRAISDRYAETCAQLQEATSYKHQMIQGVILEIDDKINMIEDTIRLLKDMSQSKTDFQSNNQLHLMHDNDLYSLKVPAFDLNLEIEFFQNGDCIEQIRRILSRIGWMKRGEERLEDSFHCSMIEREEEEIPKSVLKESKHASNSRPHMPKQSNRKLELSRSLDNAASIISKLQERSRLA